jgi:hypothetical protein
VTEQDWDRFQRWVETADTEQLRLLWRAVLMAWASKHQGHDLRGWLTRTEAT